MDPGQVNTTTWLGCPPYVTKVWCQMHFIDVWLWSFDVFFICHGCFLENGWSNLHIWVSFKYVFVAPIIIMNYLLLWLNYLVAIEFILLKNLRIAFVQQLNNDMVDSAPKRFKISIWKFSVTVYACLKARYLYHSQVTFLLILLI